MNHESATNGSRHGFSLSGTSKSIFGVVLAAIGAGLQMAFGRTVNPETISVIAIAFAIAGLIVTALGISDAPRNTIALLVGCAAGILACLATHPNWDSAILLFQVAAAVSGIAAIVVNLSKTWQRIVVSGLVVFHFLGIFSAITSPQPQPWISNWAWVTLFRPHLIFCYTNNAYQFYSPDPGPARLLWFCVEMKDGTKTWYKVPRKPESRLDPMAVEFFRRLSITESVNQNYSFPPGDAPLQRRRQFHGTIPLHPDFAEGGQYLLPQEHARRILGSYARHVAGKYGGADAVQSVRVYRVSHEMLTPAQFADGEDPYQPTTYYPYFMGKYDVNGYLIDADDPMLFWLVPIIRKTAALTPTTSGLTRQFDVMNYLAVHAGSDPFEF